MTLKALLTTMLTASLVLSGCAAESTDQPDTENVLGENTEKVQEIVPEVQIQDVARGDFRVENTFIGFVKANKSVDVKSLNAGTAKTVSFTSGDEVKEGDTLVVIDQSSNNETVVNYNNLSTQLSNELRNYQLTDSLTRESVRQAETSVTIAETTLINAKTALEDTKITTKNDIATAELDLETARINNTLSVEVAKEQVASANIALENTFKNFDKALKDAREDATRDQITVYNDLINHLDSVNDVAGIEPQSRIFNDEFDEFLGKLKSQTVIDVRNLYEETERRFVKLHQAIDKEVSIEELLEVTLYTAEAVKATVDKTDEMLIYSVTNQVFTPEDLDTLKSKINTTQSSINQNIIDLEGHIQNIEQVIITYENNIKSDQSAIDSAKKGLQQAQEKISDESEEVSIQNAKRKLESTKAQTQLSLNNAEAQVKSAESQLANSIASLDNSKRNRDVQLQSIQARIDDLQGDLQLQQLNIDDLTIKAPFDGTILTKDVEEGDELSQNQAIAELADLSRVKITFQVSETEKELFEKGQFVVINQKYPAKIIKIQPRVDPETRKYEIEVHLENSQSKFLPETLVDVTTSYIALEDTIFVPLNAVQIKQDGKQVFVVDQNNVATIQPVTTGKVANNMVEIIDGLTPGDHIVTTGFKLLKTGMKVEIQKNNETELGIDEETLTKK